MCACGRGTEISPEDPYRMMHMTMLKTQLIRFFAKHTADVTVGVLVAVFGIVLVTPRIAAADPFVGPDLPSDKLVAVMIDAMQNETRTFGELPEAEIARPRYTYTVPLTAYNSEPGQTDDTPCITASGYDLCEANEENIVAANFLPLGTKVRIPELFGDRVFTVEDRMNARYTFKMDIWMKQKSDARAFGLKTATIEVF